VVDFSLVMCIYEKESPAFLAKCIESVLAQTALPSEWIIVKDGPLPDELDSMIASVGFSGTMKIIALPENATLGPARAEGLLASSNEWVAIMDSDDICRCDRFEKQLRMIDMHPELGLIGGQIAEFSENPGDYRSIRAVPLEHDDICKFLKKRNPFNSMTVMLKREPALAAGNYRYFPWFEDYDLWARMIKSGVICANLPDVLVDARTGSGMYGRRRGAAYMRSEWNLLKGLRSLGLINRAEFCRNAALRMPLRLLPAGALEWIYGKYIRS